MPQLAASPASSRHELATLKRPKSSSDKPLKQSDFISRLNQLPYYLGDELLKTDGKALERVYVGAFSIVHRFSDVKQVSEMVLRAFHDLEGCSLREIRNYVEDFSGVVGGRVSWQNLGKRMKDKLKALKRPEPSPAELKSAASPDKRMVEILLKAADSVGPADWQLPCEWRPRRPRGVSGGELPTTLDKPRRRRERRRAGQGDSP